MNPRSAINFFKTPAGAFIGFCLILTAIFFGVKRFLPGATQPPIMVYSTKAAAAEAGKQTLQTFQNTNYSPVQNPPSVTATATSGVPANATMSVAHAPVKVPPKPEVLPISLFAETPAPVEQKSLSKNYAPFGRLIPCELIVTVDSSSMQTPIVGLVTEDIYFGGRLLIPAGTEIHGKAQTDRVRERIASSGGWTFVWQDGRELRVSGLALDREEAGPPPTVAEPAPNAPAAQDQMENMGWAITDGSAGLRGRVLKTDDMAEIKLFAASFLSGAASAFTENRQTVFGTEVLPNAKNAGLEGMQSVIQAYAKQIYDSIQRDGFYVRVAAGKQFYLYVTQTIDTSDAAIGGTRLVANDFAETNQPAAVHRSLPPAAAAYLNRVLP